MHQKVSRCSDLVFDIVWLFADVIIIIIWIKILFYKMEPKK